jgi:hypothetical protein
MKFQPHSVGGCGVNPEAIASAAFHLIESDVVPGQGVSHRLKALDCHGGADDGSARHQLRCRWKEHNFAFRQGERCRARAEWSTWRLHWHST